MKRAHRKARRMEEGQTLWAALLLVAVGCSVAPFAEKTTVAPVNAGEGTAVPAAGTGTRAATQLDRELQLASRARTETAKRLLSEAKELMGDLRYVEAEKKLQEAVRLDPTLQEAQHQLDQVRHLLGRLPGERGVTTREFYQEQRLRTEEAQATVRRLMVEGEGLMAQGRYEEAAEKFKRVVQIDSYFPWNLNMPDAVALARKRAQQAERLARDLEFAQRKALEEQLAQRALTQRAQDLRYFRNRIAGLLSRAKQAFNDARFKKAEAFCQQILELDPRHEEAQWLLKKSRRMEHFFTQDRIYRTTARNWDLVFRNVEEAAIPYGRIFRYPPKKIWEKLGTQEVSLEERVAAEEPLVNREIRRRLEQTKIQQVSFTDRPLKEVLDFLSTVSQISFVPNREAREAMEADDESLKVNLAEVQGLSVKTILELVLGDLGDSGYGYQIKNGAVVIGPKESLEKKMYLQFYPVEDIAVKHPDYKAPPLAVNLRGEQGAEEEALVDLGLEEEQVGPPVGPELLKELINKRILGDDEANGTVDYQSGKLVVRTTLENHRKIRELLESLRQLSGVLVAVEARFLDLQDNLLDEIGIEFGGPVESTLEYPIPDVNGLGTSVASGYAFIDRNYRYEVRAANLTSYSGVLGTAITPFNITPDGGGALQYTYLDEYQLEAIITAVSKRQKSRTLDAPRVIAFDSQTAYTMVIDQIAYIKDVDVNQTGVSPVINPLVGSFRVGSMLEIRPTVTYDRKYVILEVEPTTAQHVDSEFAQLNLAQGFTVVQVELPVILMTQIKTTITVPDGGTVLVGGLKKVIEQNRSIGIPIINRIPVLNIIFGRIGQTRLRNNLFVMIKAQIVIVKEQERLNFP